MFSVAQFNPMLSTQFNPMLSNRQQCFMGPTWQGSSLNMDNNCLRRFHRKLTWVSYISQIFRCSICPVEKE